MAQISKITLPSGTTYDLKDAWARSQIEGLVGGEAIIFAGVSSTALVDGGTQSPTVDGSTVTPSAGQLYFYGTQEFVWGKDNKWHELGSLDSLGDLAYKNTATGSFTPHGTVSQPTFTGSSSAVTITATDNASGNYQPKGTVSTPNFTGTAFNSTGKFTPSGEIELTTSNKTATVSTTTGTATYTPGGTVGTPTISVKTAGSTTTIKNPTSVTVAKTVVAAAPGETAPNNSITYYSVSNQTLSLYQLGYTTGASITTSNVTVKDGDAEYQSSQPSWTGTGVRLVTGNIAVPTSAAFTGTEDDVTVSGTATGSISQPTFTGTKTQLSGTTTAAGSISQPTFTGTGETITVS